MAVSLLLGSREHDLGGGLVIRRLLPSAKKQGVGPFLFFDHFGPTAVAADGGGSVTGASGTNDQCDW